MGHDATAGRCEAFDSIGLVPPDDWRLARGGEPSGFTDPAFLRSVEGGLPDGARVWHVLVRGTDGRPAGCASLCLLDVDLFLLAGPRLRRLGRTARRLLPRAGRLKLLFCGLPVSAGQGHLAFADGADPVEVIDALDAHLGALARREAARAVVYKEFGEGDALLLDRLRGRGYVRADSPPTYELARPFPDFEAYCASLKSHYRNDVRRSQKKFDKAGCSVVHLRDPAEIVAAYTPEVHRLYEAVVDKSEVKLEVLPVPFFHRLAEEMAGRVTLTAVYRDGRIVAFNWGLRAGRTYHFLFCGIDYAANGDADLYFNVMYHQLDLAYRGGAEAVRFGQTADAFKTRVGCTARPLCFYVRGRGLVLPALIRRAGAILFPPRAAHPANDVFKAEPPAKGRKAG